MPAQDVTKCMLAKALEELSHHESFDRISVAELARQAHVNRKTFYYHFNDKYDLLGWCLDQAFLAELGGQKEPKDFWSFYTLLLSSLNNYKGFCRNVFLSDDRVYFNKILRQFLWRYIVRYVPRKQVTVKDKYDECIGLLCATFAVSLEEWIVHWPNLSCEDLIEISRFDKIV